MICSKQRGQMVVLFALLLPVLLIFASLAINLGNIYMRYVRLQNAADAAALAMASAYNQSSGENRENIAKEKALKIAKKNLYLAEDSNLALAPDSGIEDIALTPDLETTVATVTLGENVDLHLFALNLDPKLITATSRVRLSDLKLVE